MWGNELTPKANAGLSGNGSQSHPPTPATHAPDCSSMILLVGLPAPCPARTSMRVSSGLRWGELGAPGFEVAAGGMAGV